MDRIVEKGICPDCKLVQSLDNNFCPKCGKALTKIAEEYVYQIEKSAQLKLLMKMADGTNDEAVLKYVRDAVARLQ